MKHIYEVHAEIEPLQGAEMSSNLNGAFVSCYVPADGLEKAISLVRGKLEGDKYQIVAFEWALKIDLDDWEPEDSNAPSIPALRAALETCEIFYGSFYSYEHRSEH